MEFPEYYKPSSIFFNLFSQIFEFSSSKSEPVAVFFQKRFSIPFPEEISEGIPDHRSDNGNDNNFSKGGFTEESTDEEHDLLTRDKYSDYRERFDDTARKGDEIIPTPEQVNLSFHPTDEEFNPFRLEYHNPRQSDDDERKQEIEYLEKYMRNMSDDFFVHEIIWVQRDYYIISCPYKTSGSFTFSKAAWTSK